VVMIVVALVVATVAFSDGSGDGAVVDLS